MRTKKIEMHIKCPSCMRRILVVFKNVVKREVKCLNCGGQVSTADKVQAKL